MGNITEICNQTENVESGIGKDQTEEHRYQTVVELATAPEQLQQEISQLRQQEEFRQFCANKILRKHNEREEYYLGEWEGGYRKGRAVVFMPGEYLYWGDVDRVPHGRGTLKLYPQNIVVEGQMREGRPEGTCIIRDLTGLYTFEGLINAQQLPTSGRFEVANQAAPEKSYSIILDQYPNNPARISFRDGGEYVGELSFESLLPHGEGEENYANKAVYAGGWENGQYHGRGKFTWPDGSSYDGEYVRGVKEGKGTYCYVSRKVYRGEWANGKQEGHGMLMSPEGKMLKRGVWANGSFVREEEQDIEL